MTARGPETPPVAAPVSDASPELAAFLVRVGALGGPPDERTRRAAVTTTLRALARRLTAEERAWLVREVPGAIARELSAPAETGEPDASASMTHPARSRLFHEVRRATGLPLGRAIETAEVVCRVLAECVTPARRSRLSALASRELGGLFDPVISPRSEVARPPTPQGTTLASGAPGSPHSRSGAAPRSGQLGSVARWDGSPAARTLAGYRGSGRARAGDTLATGRPGSRRSLASAKAK